MLLTTKEKDVYTVGPLYKTNNELMPIKIDLPKGYVIDKEHSDLDKGIILSANERPSLKACSSSFPDGKAQRRESRRRAIRRRKGRL